MVIAAKSSDTAPKNLAPEVVLPPTEPRLAIVPTTSANQGGRMNFKSLQRKAKQLIDKRGGTDSVKEDAQELMNIAKGSGSVGDKAKRAGEALKDPGAKGPNAPASPQRPAPGTSAPRDEPDMPQPGSPSGA